MAANGSIVYTLTSVFHEYKAPLSELEVETHVYTTKKQAREAMLSLARCQYKESNNIQGSRNKYLKELDLSVEFGETNGLCTEDQEWGFCRIEAVKMNEMPVVGEESSDDDNDDDLV